MSIKPTKIVDAHTHLAWEGALSGSFLDGVVRNVVARLSAQGVPVAPERVRDLYLSKLQDPHGDELVREMDDAGIERSILLIPDFTYALRDAKYTIAELIDHHFAVRKRHAGRFEIFVGVDPRWGADGIALFEHAVRDLGAAGLKLYPPCGYTPSDSSLDPYYEICAAHRLPVLMHIGPTSPALRFDTAHPRHVDDAALRFPNVSFILAHASVSHVDDCVLLAEHRPNIFLEVSGFCSGPPDCVAQLFRRGVAHKLIFGTDFPVFRMHGTQPKILEDLIGPSGSLQGLSPLALNRFFHRNIEELLGSSRGQQAAKPHAALGDGVAP